MTKNIQDVKRAMTEIEAAIYINMSRSFLRKSRMSGFRPNRTPGPRYVLIGRSIRYLKDDLDRFLESRRIDPLDA